MTEIPSNAVTQDDLNTWYTLQEDLKRVKSAELLLRQKIFGAYFPAPKEGTNDVPLDGGYVLKGKYSILREVDPGAVRALMDELIATGVRPDELVQYRPSLVLKEYRTLTEEQRHLFDQCLIIKPGSPALEIVLPAKAKKAGEKA